MQAKTSASGPVPTLAIAKVARPGCDRQLVDLLARHETVDLNHVGALDLDRFELRVLDDQVLPPGNLVATALVLGIDRLAGFLIDELLTQPIAGRLVDLPEGNALCARAGGVQCDRARDQGQLKIAFPVGTHGLMRAKAHGSRQQFMQQPKVLSPKRRGSEGNTGDVAARPVEAGDEAELNRAPPFAKTKVFRSGGLPVSVCLAI